MSGGVRRPVMRRGGVQRLEPVTGESQLSSSDRSAAARVSLGDSETSEQDELTLCCTQAEKR